jgi:two-component system, NarL family, sensor histidine kinase DesK
MISGSDGLYASVRYRRIAFTVAIAFALLQPAYNQLAGHPDATSWILVGGAVVMAGLSLWALVFTDLGPPSVPWPLTGALLALGITLFVLGGDRWLGALAVAAAMCGRLSQTNVAVPGVAACTATGIALSAHNHYSFGNAVATIVVPPLAGLFAYSAARRAEAVESLRRTRAELARAAAAEERLRIARDLHDLLGHSLSLITIKAELAGRLMTADPERAAREVSELESVARQSLSDVREAVAGFRQPDLTGELVAARQLLDAAGIATQITSADISGLSRAADSALAWAVREGSTNVVRHSRATQVAIRVSCDADRVVAEITDNGPAAPELTGTEAAKSPVTTAGPDGRSAISRARPVFGGSGLAGLAERVRSLGGELAAGSVEPRGFKLRVVVPINPETAE